MRLLIVEDEKKLCDAIAKSLHGAGYEVDVCYDGDDGDPLYLIFHICIVIRKTIQNILFRVSPSLITAFNGKYVIIFQ